MPPPPRPQLLSGGRLVFHGPRELILPFFSNLGFECPDDKGDADFLQEVTTFGDQRVKSNAARASGGASAAACCRGRRRGLCLAWPRWPRPPAFLSFPRAPLSHLPSCLLSRHSWPANIPQMYWSGKKGEYAYVSDRAFEEAYRATE